MKTRPPTLSEIKSAYDAATGNFVERCQDAAEALNWYYIEVAFEMGKFRGPTGAGPVIPVPANWDPIRDADPVKDAHLMKSWRREKK